MINFKSLHLDIVPLALSIKGEVLNTCINNSEIVRILISFGI